MEFSFILTLLGIALIDSINPSALFSTFFLITTNKPIARTLSYIFGIFTTYFLLGLLALGGLSSISNILSNIISYQPGTLEYIVQLIIGLILIVLGVLMKTSVKEEEAKKPRSLTPFATFLLGVTITFVESSTAAPYFGAIALLSNSDITIISKITLLFLYNLIFILPPALILILRILLKEKSNDIFIKLQKNLQKASRYILKYILIFLGIILIIDTINNLIQV